MDSYGIIMAGGGGTRFWPLSRHKTPKQLLNLSGKDTMIGETVSRMESVTGKDNVFIVTNKDQVPGMKEVLSGRLSFDKILSEPYSRNTAACIGYAAVTIRKKYGDAVMCISPSDHFIKNNDEFKRVLSSAVEHAKKEDVLITLGIKPEFPSTGYGYIKYDASQKDAFKKVLEFKEKPDFKTAEDYVSSGEYVWNSGMFVFKASTVLKEFEKYLPDIYKDLLKIEKALLSPDEERVLEEIYKDIKSISIDYGIMEKSDNVYSIQADMGWSDVGSFDNLSVIYEADKNNNIHNSEEFIDVDSRNIITYSKNKKLIASLGVEDIMIIETDDAILVAKKTCAQDVKTVYEKLKEEGKEEYL